MYSPLSWQRIFHARVCTTFKNSIGSFIKREISHTHLSLFPFTELISVASSQLAPISNNKRHGFSLTKLFVWDRERKEKARKQS